MLIDTPIMLQSQVSAPLGILGSTLAILELESCYGMHVLMQLIILMGWGLHKMHNKLENLFLHYLSTFFQNQLSKHLVS